MKSPTKSRFLQLASAVVLLSLGTVAQNATPAAAGKPTAAVALGDSFISGEGAGNYANVIDNNGVSQGFPGWQASNQNAFFCHRSNNASIEVADLPGIDARFNLACSGGQPYDITSPSFTRTGQAARQVDSQIAQLRRVAETHDIDVVLIGLGSNNSQFTFGDAATVCIKKFFESALPPRIVTNKKPGPCTSSDLTSEQQRTQALNDTIDAVRQIVLTLDEIDPDGEHRIVLQDYTNPLPPDFDHKWHREGGRSDTSRRRFMALANERYQGGCPVHRASLQTASSLTAQLGNLVRQTSDAIGAEFDGIDLQYLNVQSAFDGARLCERVGSPGNALATPARFQRQANGKFEQSVSGWKLRDFGKAVATCFGYYQTCQESFHPNAAGHAVLGQCLAAAVRSQAPTVKCWRDANSGVVHADDVQPALTFTTYGDSFAIHPNEIDVLITYDLTAHDTWLPITNVLVTAKVGGRNGPSLPDQAGTSGWFRFTYRCDDPDVLPQVTINATATFDGTDHPFSEVYLIDTSACGGTTLRPTGPSIGD